MIWQVRRANQTEKCIMKFLTLSLVTALALSSAPAMAQNYMQNCPFKDNSLCVVESLSQNSGEANSSDREESQQSESKHQQ